MFRSRNTTSRAKAARDLQRELMTMEVVSGDEDAEMPESSSSSSSSMSSAVPKPSKVPLPDQLCFGPYGIAPLRGLHYDAAKDTATS
jgi:hypothetical protein